MTFFSESYLASTLPFYLAFILVFILALFLASILGLIAAFFLLLHLTIFSGILSGTYSDILSRSKKKCAPKKRHRYIIDMGKWQKNKQGNLERGRFDRGKFGGGRLGRGKEDKRWMDISKIAEFLYLNLCKSFMIIGCYFLLGISLSLMEIS